MYACLFLLLAKCNLSGFRMFAHVCFLLLGYFLILYIYVYIFFISRPKQFASCNFSPSKFDGG